MMLKWEYLNLSELERKRVHEDIRTADNSIAEIEALLASHPMKRFPDSILQSLMDLKMNRAVLSTHLEITDRYFVDISRFVGNEHNDNIQQ